MHPDRYSVGRLTRPPKTPWSHLCLQRSTSIPICGHPGDEFFIGACVRSQGLYRPHYRMMLVSDLKYDPAWSIPEDGNIRVEPVV